MKITSKTYFLLGVIIGVSVINLYLLVFTAQENQDVLHSISNANNLKVSVERIAGIANSIARGNEADRVTLGQEIDSFDKTYSVLGTGGQSEGENVVPVPDELKTIYGNVGNSWQAYKEYAENIKKEAVFDPQVTDSLKYIFGKNEDLITLTNGVSNDLSSLDRNYNKHKEIAAQMITIAKDIGEKTLLISIGEGGNATSELKKDRILFNADLKKLEGLPLDDPEFNNYDIKKETLQEIPRENSDSIRQLDPLWESVEVKLRIIESNSILSKEFSLALSNLNEQRGVLLDSTTHFVNEWNKLIDSKLRENVVLVQGLLIADVAVFIGVMLSIRRSLNPLQQLTSVISRVKEGYYGEKMDYTSKDEIGELAETFNTMSTTIQKKEEEAKKIEIAKDEFLAMITHELKTPLVPIQGYSDILLGEHLGSLNKNQKERLEVIRSSSATLLQLISDLLDVQKLELGQLKIKKSNNNIKQTVEKTVISMQPQALAEGITLQSHIIRDIYASYDEERIIQVLTNLIKNSLKASPTKTGKVEILAEEKPSEIILSVLDNGRGIPNEAIDNIFKKFYQVDTSSTREKGGSGLGLSICKGIVETHGGRIWAQSEPRKGSTFSFTIPKSGESKTPI